VPTSWITDEMRALIGRDYGKSQTSLPVALSDIRRWAAAIYWPDVPPRLFWDETYAAATSHGGVVAPEEFNPFAWFTADGPNVPPSFEGVVRLETVEASFGVTAPMTTRIMNGGGQVRYGVRMRPGDVITSGPNTLVDYQERETRLGLMLMTVSESTWKNQNGEMVKTMRSTGIRY
jgi:hypothetical protein